MPKYKCIFNETLQKEYKFLRLLDKTPDDKSKVECLTCGVRFSVAHGGRNGISIRLNQIKEKIPELDSTRQEMVLECFSVRQKDIQNILLQEKCAISGPVLQDFDWNVKWVMGSSKSSSLREPLLSLDLHLSEGRNLRKNGVGIKEKTVSLELNKEELNKLISILEKAQESVTSFQN